MVDAEWQPDVERPKPLFETGEVTSRTLEECKEVNKPGEEALHGPKASYIDVFPDESIVEVRCWDELLTEPPDGNCVVVQASGNWLARLSAAATSVQLGENTAVLPRDVCWVCVKNHIKRNNGRKIVLVAITPSTNLMFPDSFLINLWQRSYSIHRLAIVIGKAAIRRLTTCFTFRTQKTNVQKLSTCMSGLYRNAPHQVSLVPRWGFIVCRCTYQDDAASHKFITAWKSIVLSRVRRLHVDGERLTRTLDIPIKEDQPALEDAGPEVCAQHLAWARSDARYIAGLTADDGRKDEFWTRYDFCVHVDTEALQLCLTYIALLDEEQKVTTI